MLAGLVGGYRGAEDASQPGISPRCGDRGDLPPSVGRGGSGEWVLSDATVLAERAGAAGVDVELDVADGMWHVWQFLAPWLPEARWALDKAATYIRKRAIVDGRSGGTLVTRSPDH